ncbi:hepatoma-derived growth factor-related protein 2-like [Leptopilina boulardi]|uniref:hepatoma-derived growth factor-related protein 2-like n=1 Tax=Leptopilina boulardi TaxID=63433 RepID=UPI0021F502AF|nr:hepatoma-derived growth factor-related protein 2-like [Leptopilina boulardi]
MTKWLLRLQDYQYEFVCTPGKINRWLPALSENPVGKVESETEENETTDTDSSERLTPENTEDEEEKPKIKENRTFPISSAARKYNEKANKKLDHLIAGNKKRMKNTEDQRKQLNNPMRNRSKSDSTLKGNKIESPIEKRKKGRPPGKTKPKMTDIDIDDRPIATRLRSQIPKSTVTNYEAEKINDKQCEEVEIASSSDEERTESPELIPILRKQYSVLPSLVDGPSTSRDYSSESDEEPIEREEIEENKIVIQVDPPVDSSDSEEEVFQEAVETETENPVNENSENDQLDTTKKDTLQPEGVNQDTLEGILESIRRFDNSMAEHQSYFWDNKMFEKETEIENSQKILTTEDKLDEEPKDIEEIMEELRDIAQNLPKLNTEKQTGEEQLRKEKKRKSVTFDTPLRLELPKARSTPYLKETITGESDTEEEVENKKKRLIPRRLTETEINKTTEKTPPHMKLGL